MERSTLRMLIERLNWPVRAVRLMAAKELGLLLESPHHSRITVDVYLEWIATRNFESQVLSGLVVLLATSLGARPAAGLLVRHIRRPSILADLMLERLYGPGRGTGQWRGAHSGVAPSTFRSEQYFYGHLSSHVPPILSSRLEEPRAENGTSVYETVGI